MANESGKSDVMTTDKVDTFLEELSILQSKGSKKISIIGSRHVTFAHQQLIETLAYALALEGNQVITSGAPGTNFAVIKGVQRANPEKLLVILPQTIAEQPEESREQLETLKFVEEHPERVTMTLAQAGELCYSEIIGKCQQLVAFLYRSSMTLEQTIRYAQEQNKVVTAFYLD